MSPRAFLLIHLLAAALAAVGCKRTEPEQPPVAAPAAPPAPAPAQTPVPPPSPEFPPATKTEAPTRPKPGWSAVSMQDDLPICVFSSFDERESTPVFAKAKRQTLSVDQPLVIGVFEPYCLNKACDEQMLLQCWVERAGSTLTVHTRFASQRKDGATCAEDCLAALSGCQSEPLAAGAYTIRHGDKTYPLEIPSVVRAPCFDAPTPRRSRTAASP